MTMSTSMIWLIIGCTLVTLIPRVFPFIVVRSIQLPEVVHKWLSFIPVCIFTALVVEGLLVETDHSISVDWMTFIALIPTIIIAIWTKSLSLTVIGGVVFMAILRLIN